MKNDTSIIIRQAHVKDAAEIYTVWNTGLKMATGMEAQPEEARRHSTLFERQLREQDDIFQFWVVVDEDDKILGWQSLLPFQNSPIVRPLMAQSSTYVRQPTHVSGLGRKLLAHALHHATRTSIQYVFGFVVDSNLASRRLVHDLGFVCVGPIPTSDKPPQRGPESLYVYIVHKSLHGVE